MMQQERAYPHPCKICANYLQVIYRKLANLFNQTDALKSMSTWFVLLLERQLTFEHSSSTQDACIYTFPDIWSATCLSSFTIIASWQLAHTFSIFPNILVFWENRIPLDCQNWWQSGEDGGNPPGDLKKIGEKIRMKVAITWKGSLAHNSRRGLCHRGSLAARISEVAES